MPERLRSFPTPAALVAAFIRKELRPGDIVGIGERRYCVIEYPTLVLPHGLGVEELAS